jgi:cyclophilin family peptidyl-prolyl cis-trans isomerase
MKRWLLASIIIWMVTLSNTTYATQNPIVEISTNKGKIVVELYPSKRPKTVQNFLKYMSEGFYEDTIFHRVIDQFMIQGGGYERVPYIKETYPPIPNESGPDLLNKEGTLAMARKRDLNSATSQFFINTKDNPRLDDLRYTVFGKVLLGMDTIKAIEKTKTTSIAGFDDVPTDPIIIEKMTLLTIPAKASVSENSTQSQ